MRTMIQADDDTTKKLFGQLLLDELKAIHELVADIPEMKQDIEILKADVAILKSDMVVMKAIARAHNIQLDNHETRITRLEASPAH